MGCGATKDSKVGVVDSISSSNNINYNNNKSNGRYNASNNRLNAAAGSNRNLNNKAPLKQPVNGNGYQNNNNNGNNRNGFKQVDIKYSNDYQDNNNNNNKKATPTTPNKPITNGKPPQQQQQQNGKAPAQPVANGKNTNGKNQPPQPPAKGGKPPIDNKKQQNVPPPAPVAKPVAFTITFDDDNANKISVEEILKNKPPKHRFQLEPLKSRPKITQQELDEKMRAVELKREQMLAEKIKPVKQISVRQDLHREKQNYQYESSMDSASKQREARLEEIKDKQRRQDDKRQRIVKDRRNLANQELEDLKYSQFEKDKYYNSNYDDF